ncbi:MAG: GNAT family N-acetyltransferase [Candidatus Thermoplasmatota archaeon]
MKKKNGKETAREYLSQEPVVNSYQIARLDDDRSDVFLDNENDPKGVLITSDGIATLRGDLDALQDFLEENLEDDEEYRFHAIDPQSFKAVKEIVDVKDDRETWLLVRRYREPKEPKEKIDSLKEEDASVINEYWGLGGNDSTDYIKRRIKEGPAYGIRKEGELVGWSLTHFITDKVMVLGMLHIKEGWRRKGFAKAVTEAMCRESKKRGLIPAVQIFKDNEPSFSLAMDLGFEIRAEHHWFNGIKK